MPKRVVASFIVRVVHEPGNEQIPWSITIQHVQSGRVYRLADLKEVSSLLAEIVEAENWPEDARFIPLETAKVVKNSILEGVPKRRCPDGGDF
ncbi:Uncharacterized [Moorella glycerini]|uniref:Uncharacterized protein n=2 Tax=Neomoorella TaxID=44260 RepID=A0A9X7J1W3_9FIRM|nr:MULTISPECIES: hypothetical protein [Moorella]PRR71296.1 hypothetical protein MOST_26030 [Moorella stamsii]QGP91868.1 hypothetical protein MGLY_12110 [Moorella glycerini]CEP66663.1 Uncharacterized [Moorella glycerini]